MGSKRKNICASVPIEIHEAVHKLALKRIIKERKYKRGALSEIVAEALKEYLERHKEELEVNQNA